MAAGIKAAIAGPNKARVQALFVSVNGLIKSKDFAQAGKALDELQSLIATPASDPMAASVAAPPAPPSEATPPAPASDAALAADWERRVIAIEPKVLEAQKTRAGEAKWMTMFISAQDLGSNGEFAKALLVLDRLEELLKAPPAAPEDDAEEPGVSLVALQTARLKWVAARPDRDGITRIRSRNS